MKKAYTKAKILLSIAILITIIQSCKKDNQYELSSADIIAKAKSWFSKQSTGSITITTSIQTSMPLRFNPQWEDAKTEQIADASVVTVPVKTNLSKVFGEDTSFDLILQNINGVYVAKTVSVRNGLKYDHLSIQTLYNIAFTDNDQSDKLGENIELRVFNERLRTEKDFYYSSSGRIEITNKKTLSNKNSATNGFENTDRLMNMPLPGGECLNKQDWYLVETTYDENGNIIDQYIEFLFSTCLDGAGGGGGGTGNPGDDIYINDYIPETMSDFISSSITESGPTTRKEAYKWKCAASKLETFYAIDEGTHVKVSGNWQWQSLVHKAIVRDGVAVMATSTFTVVSSVATVGTYAAGMNLNWQHSLVVTDRNGNTTTKYTSGTSNSPVHDSR